MAYGLEAILIPNNIIDGGVTGISMLLGHITSVNLSIFLVILNLPFFFLGYKQIGKTFAICMLYGIVVLSVATTFMHSVDPFVTDNLLATVFGGIILGIGVGLAIRNGGVLDGTETLAILLEKKLPLSLGQIVMIFNVIIFTVAAFVFGVENALYSMMTYYIASRVIDLVIGGFDEMRSVHIISNNSEELASAISNRLRSWGYDVKWFRTLFRGSKERDLLCHLKIRRVKDEGNHQTLRSKGVCYHYRGI